MTAKLGILRNFLLGRSDTLYLILGLSGLAYGFKIFGRFRSYKMQVKKYVDLELSQNQSIINLVGTEFTTYRHKIRSLGYESASVSFKLKPLAKEKGSEEYDFLVKCRVQTHKNLKEISRFQEHYSKLSTKEKRSFNYTPQNLNTLFFIDTSSRSILNSWGVKMYNINLTQQEKTQGILTNEIDEYDIEHSLINLDKEIDEKDFLWSVHTIALCSNGEKISIVKPTKEEVEGNFLENTTYNITTFNDLILRYKRFKLNSYQYAQGIEKPVSQTTTNTIEKEKEVSKPGETPIIRKQGWIRKNLKEISIGIFVFFSLFRYNSFRNHDYTNAAYCIANSFVKNHTAYIRNDTILGVKNFFILKHTITGPIWFRVRFFGVKGDYTADISVRYSLYKTNYRAVKYRVYDSNNKLLLI